MLDMRRDFQRMLKKRYSTMIEELTGRTVLAFLSQAHVEPDLTIEIFLMDGPGPGFGALELIDPPSAGVGGGGCAAPYVSPRKRRSGNVRLSRGQLGGTRQVTQNRLDHEEFALAAVRWRHAGALHSATFTPASE